MAHQYMYQPVTRGHAVQPAVAANPPHQYVYQPVTRAYAPPPAQAANPPAKPPAQNQQPYYVAAYVPYQFSYPTTNYTVFLQLHVSASSLSIC